MVPSSSGQEVPLVSGQTALVEEGLGTELDRQAYQKAAEEEALKAVGPGPSEADRIQAPGRAA